MHVKHKTDSVVTGHMLLNFTTTTQQQT